MTSRTILSLCSLNDPYIDFNDYQLVLTRKQTINTVTVVYYGSAQ